MKTSLQILKQAMQDDLVYVDGKEPPIPFSAVLKERAEDRSKLYIQKQNNGEVFLKEPLSGDYLYVLQNDPINGWYVGNIDDTTDAIWYGMTHAMFEKIFDSQAYKKYCAKYMHFSPYLSSSNEKSDRIIQTRFCGFTMGKVLTAYGLEHVAKRAWKNKPQNHWVPSFFVLINELLKEFKRDDIQSKDTSWLTLMKGYASLENNYFLIFYKDLLDRILELTDVLEQEIIENRINKIESFLLLLALKCFYVERVLLGLGILHAHLHEGNICIEFVKNEYVFEAMNMPYSKDKMTFDFQSFLKSPETYTIIIRVIDISGTSFISDWPYDQSDLKFSKIFEKTESKSLPQAMMDYIKERL